MSLTPFQKLAAAQIAIFGPLLFVTIYITFKHGKKGLMVWPFLAGIGVFAIILGAIHIAQDGNPRLYGAGIGLATSGILSQLVLVPIGIIYEVGLFIPTIDIWMNRLNILTIHTLTILCVLLGTIFGAPSHNDAGFGVPKNRAAAEAGWILLFIVLILVSVEAIYLLFYRVRDTVNPDIAHHLNILLASILLAMPFSLARIGHEIVYLFDPEVGQNLETGPFFTIFLVAFWMPLSATVIFLVAGFLTRDVKTLAVEVVREDGSSALSRDEVSGSEGEREETRTTRDVAEGYGALWI